jgi:hypothetical protein
MPTFYLHGDHIERSDDQHFEQASAQHPDATRLREAVPPAPAPSPARLQDVLSDGFELAERAHRAALQANPEAFDSALRAVAPELAALPRAETFPRLQALVQQVAAAHPTPPRVDMRSWVPLSRL